MGISIEKTIEIFQGMKKGIYPWDPEEYCNFAIDIMRKYQKIEQIKNDVLLDIYMAGTNMTGEYHGCWVRFNDIENIVNEQFREVLEDGRNLPSVTPQLSSGLDKNSQKLENPTTKNNLRVDCVARQDVERYIEGFINAFTTRKELEFINLELAGLKHLPSVTPQEPRKGHWISHGKHCEMNNLRPSGLGSYFWCSECDCGIDSKNFSRVNYNYCPNCGAWMDIEGRANG